MTFTLMDRRPFYYQYLSVKSNKNLKSAGKFCKLPIKVGVEFMTEWSERSNSLPSTLILVTDATFLNQYFAL